MNICHNIWLWLMNIYRLRMRIPTKALVRCNIHHFKFWLCTSTLLDHDAV